MILIKIALKKLVEKIYIRFIYFSMEKIEP